MTAHAVVTMTITDSETFESYRSLAGPAMAKHNVTPLEVSKDLTHLEGEGELPTLAVILTFPDRDAALAWYNDPDIANVHALRNASGSSNIILL